MFTTTDANNPPMPQGLAPEQASSVRPNGSPVFEIAAILLLGAIAAFYGWLAYKVPVSAQDIRDASWLYSFNPQGYFSNVVGIGMAITMLMAGAAIGVARNSSLPVLLGIAMAGVLHFATLPSALLQQGVAADIAKIGCFVWESSECRSMLGVPTNGAPSIYVPREEADRTGEVFAPWYLKTIEKLDNRPSTVLAAVLGVPYYAFHTDEINAKLNAQRAELARFRAANVASSKTAH